jgi:hypothetical protein
VHVLHCLALSLSSLESSAPNPGTCENRHQRQVCLTNAHQTMHAYCSSSALCQPELKRRCNQRQTLVRVPCATTLPSFACRHKHALYVYTLYRSTPPRLGCLEIPSRQPSRQLEDVARIATFVGYIAVDDCLHLHQMQAGPTRNDNIHVYGANEVRLPHTHTLTCR